MKTTLTIVLFAALVLAACHKKTETGFAENFAYMALQLKENESLDFSTNYDSLVTTPLSDSVEKFPFTKELEQRGFKIVGTGGSFPANGYRLVSLILERDSCRCEISKLYKKTSTADTLKVYESVSCEIIRDSKTEGMHQL